MRILTQLLTLERVGGIEVCTLELTRALVARGHEVHIVHGPPFGLLDVEDMTADLEAAGAVLHGPYPLATSLRGAPAAVPRFLPAARLARRLHPDVLWLHRLEHVVWGQTVGRWSGTPLVLHLHQVPNYRRALPVLTRGVRRFVAVSEFMRERWVEAGVDPGLVDVVYNALPPESYPAGDLAARDRARVALGLPPDVPVVLFYGRLEPEKGIEVALDAWHQLAPAHHEAHLLLLGNVPPYTDPRLRSRIDELVRCGTGTLAPGLGDVVPALHAAEVVLFPTLLEEAFGRVALEALITGRPVLASRIGALPEILTGSLQQHLVPPGDAAALAAGMKALLSWRRDEPGLGAAARAHARAAFDFDTQVAHLEAVLAGARR
ncbi:glycosyltransferase involved in cell wall biosynthesis [Geodermatophilus normandii]|uniref:Glycosyltransferase involved in cell wall biosynthesis n=1 Tax=Geodermatophilus normandii TaxID=1137989 RepID=A0A317QGP4_9ACTN|nr:glycosyltransferase family 4 protein [Geodermatophilus normandii]PWW21796.1 glycosyltransferase involved in cell wall biosynthesis [Geodermatophilus normandii]